MLRVAAIGPPANQRKGYIVKRTLTALSCFLALAIGLNAAAAEVAAAQTAASSQSKLSWDAEAGVVLQSPVATMLLDGDSSTRGPVLVFAKEKVRLPLSSPKVEQLRSGEILLRYQAVGPAENPIEVLRRITISERPGASDLVEEFTLVPAKTISADLEIERPFAIHSSGKQAQAVLPLYIGWARGFNLGDELVRGEWQLGNLMNLQPSQHLGLPVVQVGEEKRWLAAICADPFFGSLYELRARQGQVSGAVRYRYAASHVPLAAGRKEVRHFGVWLASAKQDEPFGRALDAFFRLMLPDVPPAPKWTHEIAMVDYDYLSDNGQGFEKDVKELARLMSPEERRHVALCYHGWYETIGSYGYDDAKKEMKHRWLGMGRTRKVQLSPDEVRRQLKLARDLGFRTLLYFADGLLQDTAAPTGYRPAWDFVNERDGGKIGGWQGPDTWGTTYARNPANPEVFQWYQDYMAALLKAFGPVLDGFVWDETMHMRAGMVARFPQPAYGDQAMMRLVKKLTAQVRAADPQKVFLTAECAGATDIWEMVPGYSMVASGIYQDAGFSQPAWSCGLFPTWRNNLWICNWCSISQFFATRWEVQRYGVPVAISNGWGDDKGPSEWTPAEQQKILKLFRQRLTQRDRIRYLAAEPKTLGLHESDPIPQPAPGEVNWALATQGGKAAASSTSNYGGQRWGPSGLIDGRREKAGWGNGHGWASESDQPLPQWVEIDFPQPRSISRFVVVTYHGSTPGDTAEHYGVTDYEIQVWDEVANGWKTVVTENRWRAMKTRVHQLKRPVRTAKFRIVISRVAPEDGVARLVQLEAWGGP